MLILGFVLAGSTALFSLSARYDTLQQPGYGYARQSLILDENVWSNGAGCQNVDIKYTFAFMDRGGLSDTQSGTFYGPNMQDVIIPNPVGDKNLYKGFVADVKDKDYEGTVKTWAYYHCIDTGEKISAAPDASFEVTKVQYDCQADKCDGEKFCECVFPSSGGSYYKTCIDAMGKCGVECLYDAQCDSNEKCDTTKSPNACVDDCGSSTAQRKCYAGDAYYYDRCDNRKSKVDDCNSNEKCSNGYCIPACESNAYQSCYNNQVYWFNGCDQPEVAIKVCSGNNQCQVTGEIADCVEVCTSNYENKCYLNTNQIWSRDNCRNWESKVEDCVAKGMICENDICVVPEQPTCDNKPIKPCTNAVWQDYPTCKWDETNCVDPCDPQKDHKSCYNGNVWWLNNCDEPTLIYDKCELSEECRVDKCIEIEPVCIPLTETECDGNDVVQYNSCGERISLIQTCSVQQICRYGECKDVIEELCENKPPKPCDNAIWSDYPDCYWNENSCVAEIEDPCDNPQTPEQVIECNEGTTGNLEQTTGAVIGSGAMTTSQIIRLTLGGIALILGLLLIIFSSMM